jgi:hypothetical protein
VGLSMWRFAVSKSIVQPNNPTILNANANANAKVILQRDSSKRFFKEILKRDS